MRRSLKSPEECDGGGEANKGRSTGVQSARQLKFQSLDITHSNLRGQQQPQPDRREEKKKTFKIFVTLQLYYEPDWYHNYGKIEANCT